MSFFQRVAAIATFSLALAGMASSGSAVQAAERAQAALGDSVVTNVSTPLQVPHVEVPVFPTKSVEPAVRDGDVVAYPTLAAAVAAQSMSGTADEQLRCLAGAIYYESKGEPLAGQLAVAQVILNRADAGRFGDSVCDVVKQPGQFSFVRGGRIPDVDPGRPMYRTAMAIAKVALADAWESTCGRALYFHARRVAPRWNRTQVASIGNHVFYR